ncbi:MAG: alpha/beta hydrolase [Bacteroidetes bacterium]|nr:alpha/beta hydrolase [Bacteroidota bacterium]
MNTNEITYPYKVHYTQTSIGNIAFADEGKGEKTIVFLHGLANYIGVWQANIDALKNNFRCIAIDLPGNGLSAGGDLPYSVTFYSKVLLEVIQNLKLQNVTLCGHSMGGHVALITSLKAPEIIQKLVLISPSGLEHFSMHEAMMLKGSLDMINMITSEEFQLSQVINNSFFKSNPAAEKIIGDLTKIMGGNHQPHWSKMVRKSIESMLDEPVYGQLKNIHQPTIIMFGDNDLIIPNKVLHHSLTTKSIAENAKATMPNADFTILPETGHFVQIEKADIVNKYIEKFTFA